MDVALRVFMHSRVSLSRASRLGSAATRTRERIPLRLSGVPAARRQPFSVSAAAATAAPGSLPLDGYRVLDMTRVLAGVRTA